MAFFFDRLRNNRWLSHVTLICMVAFFAMTGCASQRNRISAQQSELDNLHREIRFLKQHNSQLRRELDDFKKQLSELELSSRQDKADLAAKIDDVLQQLEAVQNQLQDTNYRISAFRGGTQATPRSAEDNIPSSMDSTSRSQTPGSQAFSVDRSRELYNTAYRDLIRGNYQLALHGFQQFVSQYPNSELIDNAQYWIGEVYYAQGRYQNAIEEFEKVVKWYRSGDKTASALLKIGYAYINIDEIEQGRIYLEEIINDYPDSEEANLAKGRLASLN